MTDNRAESCRCGIDTVEIARIERLLRQTPGDDLARLFSARELAESGDGPGRAASLAARFAAKEACLKLFPREAALGFIEPGDFSVVRDNYGAPQVVPNANAASVLGRHLIRSISLSMTHDRTSASAVALAEHAQPEVPAVGRFLYRFLPLRRDVMLENLRRVFGDTVRKAEIERLAAAHYGHLWRLAGEFLRFRSMTAPIRPALLRLENVEALNTARAQGKGILILAGHFGSREVAAIGTIARAPEMRGKFHVVRRAIKPQWLDRLVAHRFDQAGFQIFPARGRLDAMRERLKQGDAIVFPLDQHAQSPERIEANFFGYPARTFKSLAIIALATGAPVLLAASRREADGCHVLRFEAPMVPIECESAAEAIRRNIRAYLGFLEGVILRHPEQWYWARRYCASGLQDLGYQRSSSR